MRAGWTRQSSPGCETSFNPYTNEIHGDWFQPKGRKHHTGAVYPDGNGLTEAARLEEVLLPEGRKPAWVGVAHPAP